MNFERYIASRIGFSSGGTFSAQIFKIAVTAVALSMMVMIITTNVITGFKNQISEKVFSFWGHIHITDGQSGNSFELVPILRDDALIDSLLRIRRIEYARPRSITNIDAPMVPKSSIGGISKVQAFTIVPGIVADRTQFEGLLLKGVEPGYFQDKIQTFIKDGAFISFPDSIASRDLLVSRYTADRMNFETGEKVNISFLLDGDIIKRQFTISGIYKTGLEEYDRRFGIVDMRLLQEVLGWTKNEVSGLEVFVDNLDDLTLLNDYIYFELLPASTYSETVKVKFNQIFEWLELQNINERVIITLMILVALINMVTALLIFVLERTNMIGILKALGATDWSIRKIFVMNAATIIIRGVLIGNVLAIVLCLIQKYTGVMKLREADYYLSEVPIEFNISSMVFINLGTIIVVAIFMLIPSMIVAQISPVKTIQFK